MLYFGKKIREIVREGIRAGNKRKLALPIVIVLAVSILAVGMVFSYDAALGAKKAGFNAGGSSADSNAALGSAPQITPQQLSNTFIQIAKQVKPSVVNINVTSTVKRQRSLVFPRIPGFPDIPEFFGGDSAPHRVSGTGSGVIVSGDGYILTNNHVVKDAEEIEVKLADGRKFKGKVVGTDPNTDLAVVKIGGDNLPAAKLGNSDQVQPGEWVMAIGSPFGLDQTLTAGIVSAKGREVGGTYDNYIQTDASINPGNSGGPLVNLNGEVIGINTLIFTNSGANQGIGFSIPSNLAHKIYTQLISNGKVVRGYLGVFVRPVFPQMARMNKIAENTGALVDDVSGSDSPSAKAGLQSGDIIVKVDGKDITSSKQLTEMVADLPVGKEIAIEYLRDGSRHSTSVKLAERPDAEALDRGDSPKEEDGDKLGVSYETVTPSIADHLGLKIRSGVVIDNVSPGGVAAEAGLTRGDVIHQLNGERIENAGQFRRAIAALKKGSDVVLQIERRGQLAFISFTLE